MNELSKEETLKIIKGYESYFGTLVTREAIRLLNSGAVEKNNFDIWALFKVAFENISDAFRVTNETEYKNLKNLW